MVNLKTPLKKSSIEWTETTWNPTTGCTECGKECLKCYSRILTNRLQHMPNHKKYKDGFDKVVEHQDTLLEPFSWKEPVTVFVNSMSDLFHKDVSLDFIKKVFKTMNETPQHTYQILTKRDHLLKRYSEELNWSDNIWMGVSVGMQDSTRKIKNLQVCGAKHKFLSVEPLIDEITDMDLTAIDLVLVGGESGDNSVRPMKKEWVVRIKEICESYKVPFFFKQWGKSRNNPNQDDPTLNKNHRYYAKGGCMLDGKLYLSNPSIKDDTVPTIKLFNDDYLIIENEYDLNTIWELKTYLPEMEETLFKRLTEDIKRNGVNDPILYWTTPENKKLVVEGHTRLKAAINSKQENVPQKEIKENFNSIDDIKLWMIKHQCQRRNLSNIEKVRLAYSYKDSIEKLAKENLSKGGKEKNIDKTIDTNAEVAKIAGVGRTIIVQYSSVLQKGSEVVKKQLLKGDITISAAHKTIKKNAEVLQPIKEKVKKKSVDYIEVSSFEEGKKQIKKGLIDCIVTLERNNKEILTKRLTPNMGVYFLD